MGRSYASAHPKLSVYSADALSDIKSLYSLTLAKVGWFSPLFI